MPVSKQEYAWFQHTAARRRLEAANRKSERYGDVSTHSRPKAAGLEFQTVKVIGDSVSTHSRPKAAGIISDRFNNIF